MSLGTIIKMEILQEAEKLEMKTVSRIIKPVEDLILIAAEIQNYMLSNFSKHSSHIVTFY